MKRSYLVYTFISLLVILYNVITLDNHVAWVDEVMINDSVAQYYLYGKWESTAYWGTPSLYVPLYSFISLLWYNIFGFYFIPARLLNIVLYFVLGGVLLKTIQKLIKHDVTMFMTFVFTMLFWFIGNMPMIYREGRPDILCALIIGFMFLYGMYYVNGLKKSPLPIILLGAMLLMSGLQACVFVIAMGFFGIIFYWNLKKGILKAIAFYLIGCCLGLAITIVFMYATGVLNSFIINTISESRTLWSIFLILAPLITEKKFGEINSDAPSLFDKIIDSFNYLPLIILLSFGFIYAIYLFKSNKSNGKLYKNITLQFYIFSIFIILIMNLAGRYYGHYFWMTFLPLVVFVTLSFNYGNRLIKFLALTTTFIITFISLPEFREYDDTGYENMKSFIDRQHFKSTDIIASPNAPFYELKKHCRTIYFWELFMPENTDKIKYVIVPVMDKESDAFMRCFDRSKLDALLENIKLDENKELLPIDSCDYPSLVVYKISDKAIVR